METDFTKLKELKYCIRLKHSLDIPLKRPRMNCAFLEGKECSFHPVHIDYLEANNMMNSRSFLKFRCVLFNCDGLTASEQKGFDRAFIAVQKEELRQCKKDYDILEKVKKLVSKEVFEDIENELEESEHWVNLRIVDEPEGDLQKSESCFKVFIDQNSGGVSGDSWAGTICIELPNGKYLIWDYWM